MFKKRFESTQRAYANWWGKKTKEQAGGITVQKKDSGLVIRKLITRTRGKNVEKKGVTGWGQIR